MTSYYGKETNTMTLMKGRLMMNGTMRTLRPEVSVVGKTRPRQRTDKPSMACASDTRPKNRVGPTSGLRGYAKIGKRGCVPKGRQSLRACIEVYFMVGDANGTARNTFSIHKHGFGYAYLLATEAYSALHNLSMLEEMDVLGKMPDKDELCSYMCQSLLARGVDIEEEELLGYLD